MSAKRSSTGGLAHAPFDPSTLSDHELDLLTVLALAESDASRSSWAESATRLGVTSPARKRLTNKDLAPVCERLLTQGVLVRGYGANLFRLLPATELDVLVASHERGRLARLAEAWARVRKSAYYGIGRTHAMTQLRLAVLLGDREGARGAIDQFYIRDRNQRARMLVEVLGPTPRPEWIALLPDDDRVAFLLLLMELAAGHLLPLDPALYDLAMAEQDKPLALATGRVLALRGDERTIDALGPLPRWGAEGLAVLRAFWAGHHAEAAALGAAAIDKMTARKYRLLTDLEGACHMLALALTGSRNPAAAAALGSLTAAAIEAGPSAVDGLVLAVLVDVHRVLTGGSATLHVDAEQLPQPLEWLPCMAWLLHRIWLDDGPRDPDEDHADDDADDDDDDDDGWHTSKRRSKKRRGVRRRARPHAPEDLALAIARAWEARAIAGGYAAVARELSALVTALEGGPRTRIVAAFDPPAPWEAALASLEAVVETSVQASASEVPARRLLWEVAVTSEGALEAVPRIVGSARARKGRAVPIARLLAGEAAELLDDSDRAVLAGIEPARDDWPTSPSFGPRAIAALVGHPRVISPQGTPVAIERGTPAIVSRRRKGLLHVDLRPAELLRHEVFCTAPDPERVVVYVRDTALAPLATVLANGRGLAVPEAARERLARVLARLGTSASATIEGELSLGIETRPADPRPLLQLGWDGSILDVHVRVAPLGPSGPRLHPGSGSTTLVAEVHEDGGPRLARCTRDPGLELARHRALLEACPVLAGFAEAPLHHRMPSLPDALDVVLELQALEDAVTLAWAAGQRLDVPGRAELSQLRVEVSSYADWLGVTGTLAADEATVLRFAELLGPRPGGRYVPIGRGRFLALSEALRRHLDSLASLGTLADGELRTSPVGVSMLDELAAEAEVSFDASARARLEALHEIARWVPRVPRGFQATLRDYQGDGFVWISRLARAGLGACLADDMGLGKTVQTLALLCQRARLGPALVVCPTSVVRNWTAEAERFAPMLRVHVLAQADDRSARLGALASRDVVVCSYGLLSSEIDALAETRFASLVFDEAHALKNQTTKRALAAGRLRADFRLALTGTPVENHLGELWSLFHLLVPGLLGDRSRFDERFAAPIAAGDRERASQLRALLRPFLLRRTKAQVLDELPPRSDVTLRVQPSPEERAFYEAVRRKAVERVAELDPKKARFTILAELTRLRQAAIDPRLVDAAAAPPGAKLDVLLEQLEELREQGHRALVFTQFLGSMALLRDRLRAAGIEHLELDGSTPEAERARRIEAFQAGEGDVFVLSLRAGGLGVNLTGADYVFHLDPWWNPAVEDQATDRAHRIGQRRPVTVYRLITEGTVEDKIVALHESKRQLADDVLAGHERASTPDLDELRRLLEP